jgi:hypothetical protein
MNVDLKEKVELYLSINKKHARLSIQEGKHGKSLYISEIGILMNGRS